MIDVRKYSPSQPRDRRGRWTSMGGGAGDLFTADLTPDADDAMLEAAASTAAAELYAEHGDSLMDSAQQVANYIDGENGYGSEPPHDLQPPYEQDVVVETYRQAVRNIQHDWGMNSNRGLSGTLQDTVYYSMNRNESLGIDSLPDVLSNDGEGMGAFLTDDSFLSAWAEHNYQRTQALLAEKGITELTLYRGVQLKDSFIEDMWGDVESADNIQLRPLSSTTRDMGRAEGFATDGDMWWGGAMEGEEPVSPYLQTMTVKAEDVFDVGGLGFPSLEEVTVLGGWHPGSVQPVYDGMLMKYDPNQPRDERGRWTSGGGIRTTVAEWGGGWTVAPTNAGGDPVLAEIARVQGFDQQPTTVTDEEYAQIVDGGGKVLYRGLTGNWDEDRPHEAIEYAEEFQFGDYYAGRGVMGSGTYMTESFGHARSYADGEAQVIEAVLRPGARTISTDAISKMRNDAFDEWTKGGGDPWVYPSPADWGIWSNDGTFAAAMGYDAIVGSNTLVLNRGALAMKEPQWKRILNDYRDTMTPEALRAGDFDMAIDAGGAQGRAVRARYEELGIPLPDRFQKYDPSQPRDRRGRWTSMGALSGESVTLPGLDTETLPEEPYKGVNVREHKAPDSVYDIDEWRRTNDMEYEVFADGSGNILREEAQEAVADGLQRYIDESELRTRVRTDTIQSVFEEGMKNQHGAGDSVGYYDPEERALFENGVFDIEYDNFTHPDEYPKYGYFHHPDDLNGDGAEFYGEAVIKWKPEVRSRTTFTVGDSWDEKGWNSGLLPSPARAASAYSASPDFIIQNSATHGLSLAEAKQEISLRAYEDALSGGPNQNYVEAQIHGRLGVDDIESVTFPHYADPVYVEDFVHYLQDNGIETPVYQEGYAGFTVGRQLNGPVAKYNPSQPRDERGRWTSAGGGVATPEPRTMNPIVMSEGISDAEFQNTLNGVMVGFNAIEATHALPGEMRNLDLRVWSGEEMEGFLGPGVQGAYSPNYPGGLHVRTGGYVAGAAVHELGHLLDYEYLNITANNDGLRSREADDLMYLLKYTDYDFGIRAQVAAEPWRASEAADFRTYLADERELFGRGYTQWVATRSGDPYLWAELEPQIGYAQWRPEDFEPIAGAFDDYFASAGLGLPVQKYSPSQPRDERGRWTDGGAVGHWEDDEGIPVYVSDNGRPLQLGDGGVDIDLREDTTMRATEVLNTAVPNLGEHVRFLSVQAGPAPVPEYEGYRGAFSPVGRYGSDIWLSDEHGASSIRATLYHEVGHALDWSLGHRKFASENGQVTRLMNAIEGAKMNAFDLMTESEQAYSNLGTERLARAFSQYAALRGMDFRALDSIRSEFDQWGDEEFEPIAAEFDKLFGVVQKYSPDQPRDDRGRWTSMGGFGASGVLNPDIAEEALFGTTDHDVRTSFPSTEVGMSHGDASVLDRMLEEAPPSLLEQGAKQLGHDSIGDAVEAFTHQWNTDSNAGISLDLQNAAEREFGTTHGTQELVLGLYRDHVPAFGSVNALTQAYVRANYRVTQERFASTGVTGKVRLYRGKARGLPDDYLPRPLSSWSTDRAGAEAWARTAGARKGVSGTLLVADVPVEDILSVGGFGAGLSELDEVIVLGRPDEHVTAIDLGEVRKYSPSQPRDERGRWTSVGGFAGSAYEVARAYGFPEDRAVKESEATRMADAAFAQIAKVHDIPTPDRMGGVLSVYHQGPRDPGGFHAGYYPKGREIVLTDDAGSMDFVHEYGHHLDGRFFGKTDSFRMDTGSGQGDFTLDGGWSRTGGNPKVKGVMDAIYESHTWNRIMEGNRPVEQKLYMQQPGESFARAYAQWVSYKSGNTAELNMRRSDPGWEDFHWTDREFIPIGRAMDQLFENEGLLKFRGFGSNTTPVG